MANATNKTRFRFWLGLVSLIGVIVPRRLRAGSLGQVKFAPPIQPIPLRQTGDKNGKRSYSIVNSCFLLIVTSGVPFNSFIITLKSELFVKPDGAVQKRGGT
jgi:hypothetical protein